MSFMKIKEGFLVREVAGNSVVVPVGEEAVDFNGVITINESGKFIWELMQNGIDKYDLLEKFMAEYGVSEETAKEDIRAFVQTLLDNGIAEV